MNEPGNLESSTSHLRCLPVGVVWFLDGFIDETRTVRRVSIDTLPFTIGRGGQVTLSLDGTNVSRNHAEVFFFDGRPMVRDLGSRNGTFVNYQRIGVATALKRGDVVHFSNSEFRLGCMTNRESTGSETERCVGSMPRPIDTDAHSFLELLSDKSVMPLFQNIIRLRDGAVLGCEVLGRGAVTNYFNSPSDLFRVAGKLGLEEALSRVFREKGLAVAASIAGLPLLFVNAHPSELHEPDLLVAALAAARLAHPQLGLVVEIPESLVTNLRTMRNLRHALHDNDVKLAYDDFGAGQGRLVELAEVPPDFLKFDISLVQGLHAANTARRQMVQMLVRFASELGIATIAEGVENASEADAVKQIGFHAAQGFYYARPVAADEMMRMMSAHHDDTNP